MYVFMYLPTYLCIYLPIYVSPPRDPGPRESAASGSRSGRNRLKVMQSDVNRLNVMQSVPNCLTLAPWTAQLGSRSLGSINAIKDKKEGPRIYLGPSIYKLEFELKFELLLGWVREMVCLPSDPHRCCPAPVGVNFLVSRSKFGYIHHCAPLSNILEIKQCWLLCFSLGCLFLFLLASLVPVSLEPSVNSLLIYPVLEPIEVSHLIIV